MKYSWLVNVVSIAGIIVCLVVVPKDTVTVAPAVKSYQGVMHDGRYGDYNESVAEECAVRAMITAAKISDADAIFNRCVRLMRITI